MASKEDDEKLYAFEPYVEGIVCPRGHKVKREILTDLRDEYPYCCLECDENYFKFEVRKEKNI